ncbi:hypothetical protein [Helicobacter suis]|uniref:hypothetical protein n=1 Tax=Helicobacter suis TaxID=104628 RepID=UPI0013D45B90|nr:hypothetical protein [Helicobacter suis]
MCARVWLSLVLCGFLNLLFCIPFSLRAIQESIQQMAIHHVIVLKDIVALNEQLDRAVMTLRARGGDQMEATHAALLLRESITLYQVLQDYYTKDATTFDYMEGILQAYVSIKEDASRSAQLVSLIPLLDHLLNQITTQLQAMTTLEHKISRLMER